MQRRSLLAGAALLALTPPARAQGGGEVALRSFALPRNAYPHDVAVGADGIVWYSGQKLGVLGRLDPRSGEVRHIPLGEGAAPHGVIMGPGGEVWITEGGQNAIGRYIPATNELKLWKLPEETGYANLNTCALDRRGRVWFTGQAGFYGVLTPASGEMRVWRAPRGRGPYGITATPEGRVFYCSLAGSFIAEVDLDSGESRVIEPPTPRQGARRVWSDSKGNVWVSEWNAGNLAVHDPKANTWRTWHLPGNRPQCYAVYVDEHDRPWVTDWGANAIRRFDPRTESFASVALPRPNAHIRQINGRPGEVWFGESGTDHIVMART
jgi:virginiamycin B lyase